MKFIETSRSCCLVIDGQPIFFQTKDEAVKHVEQLNLKLSLFEYVYKYLPPVGELGRGSL